ncbi:MAG TPA: single-stranded-DNA-specific exonuclease RecJ [Cyclobacteriaceae bacterium]|nr:single-stranded-DNA-specific exonuclease RecJ [Cyclobacteriaceae bacterium]HMV07791.1 single-stranded-DNA-specific exonuclease RecJ [Cyclobacteriaceae bacterium]HMV88059.1 single-stranded-DNA-specific exonuclease RecJ [Cyclobacteriaceae bacterium]HMW98926.1 single-stranded-DNA-specific exonuclease RecJ [Cyclobacteriaceae bacterium]HMX48441.1 single-stranded-DNA-specific exonuclease RecJ [Cyclobacteriaceae bacterium]
MEKRWIYKQTPPREAVEKLSQEININPYLSTILVQRGTNDFDSAKAYFRPTLDKLHDPFLMKDMQQAVDRLKQAVDTGEKILVYGDYDVDGTTAVALVYSYLREFHPHCAVYIPDRHKEGYGVSRAGIEWADENGYSLIIALDCGIKASDMVVLADHKGIDFIICDHHLPDEEIPNAVAVLDPKRNDCHYPYKELSGCALGFKLIQAFARQHRNEQEVYRFLDLVAVSTASDIVPITGENRILTYFGLKKLNENPLPGLKALREVSQNRSDLDVSGIVFTLGPRINAAGRVAHASAAVELLIAETESEALELAGALNLNNDTRRQFDLDITEEALSMIHNNEVLRSAKSTVLFKNTWHKGVIGIVAARCIEKYYRPTVILTESNDKITGSARSVMGFDLYEAICKCSDLLEKFGGHKYAAGLTMEKKNLEAFQQRFEEVVTAQITSEMLTPSIEIDTTISFDAITPKFINVLKQMAPFGPENQRPVFEAQNVYVSNSLSNFKDRHVKFTASQEGNGSAFQVVGFDLGEHYEQLAMQTPFRMAFTIEENYYNGYTSIQLRAKDIKFD